MKSKNLFFIMGFFLLNSTVIQSCSKDECEGCKGKTIIQFSNEEAILRKSYIYSVNKYTVELVKNYDYAADILVEVCDSNLVKDIPKNKNGVSIIFSGTGKEICGGRGISRPGFIDITEVRLKK